MTKITTTPTGGKGAKPLPKTPGPTITDFSMTKVISKTPAPEASVSSSSAPKQVPKTPEPVASSF